MTDIETLRMYEVALVEAMSSNRIYMSGLLDNDEIAYWQVQQDVHAWSLARVREAIAKAERCPSCSGCGFQERQGSPNCDACEGTGKR